MTPAALELLALRKTFGAHTAVRDFNLHVAPGEMIVLLGPSGCGKTTMLRMIAGFQTATSGDIRLDGSSILAVPPHRRDIGIVFQSYALFPHLTAARNVRFGLEMRRMPAEAADQRVAEMLRLVKLDTYADRLPRELSGGQQQRVALARALAIQPRLLLLDEPLSNLDAALRQEMAREIRILQRERGITAIVVTHDQGEAMAMADRLVVMRDGGVEQIGSQEDLYERPATPFVAGFIGQSNLLQGTLADASTFITNGSPIALAASYQGAACLALRPETIHLAPRDASPLGASAVRAEATVKLCTYLGTVVEHLVSLDSGTDLIVRGPGIGQDATRRHAPGTRVALIWDVAAERVFDPDGRPVLGTAVDQSVMTDGGDRFWTR
jgi:putative spermidine/putrescine transport system ATP-binding protein